MVKFIRLQDHRIGIDQIKLYSYDRETLWIETEEYNFEYKKSNIPDIDEVVELLDMELCLNDPINQTIAFMPENDDAVLKHNKASFDNQTEFNSYKKRIYGDFYNGILNDDDVGLKHHKIIFDINNLLPMNTEMSVAENIYNAQYILRIKLSVIIDGAIIDRTDVKQTMYLIRRICGGEDKEILEALNIRNFSDKKDFLNDDEITFIKKYFDLDEFDI